MNKGFWIKVAKIIVKYLLPVVIGYFEGNTHVVEDSLMSVF